MSITRSNASAAATHKHGWAPGDECEAKYLAQQYGTSRTRYYAGTITAVQLAADGTPMSADVKYEDDDEENEEGRGRGRGKSSSSSVARGSDVGDGEEQDRVPPMPRMKKKASKRHRYSSSPSALLRTGVV